LGFSFKQLGKVICKLSEYSVNKALIIDQKLFFLFVMPNKKLFFVQNLSIIKRFKL